MNRTYVDVKRHAGLMLALVMLIGGYSRSVARAETIAVEKPMGAWFPSYEKCVLDDEFVWGTGAAIETFYAPADWSRLPKYSAIFLGWRTTPEPMTDAQTESLHQWVSDGGNLVLFYEQLRTMWANKPPAWFAGEGAQASWSSKPFMCAIQKPDHPLLRGLADVIAKAGAEGEKTWEADVGIYGFTAGTSIIGVDNISLLYENICGKGRILVVGPALVPSKAPQPLPGQSFSLHLTPLHRQFWTNLVEYLKVPNRHDDIAKWAAARGTSAAPVALWYREPQTENAIGAPSMFPARPIAGEEMTEIRYDMAIGERNRRDVFVTATRDISVTLEPSDLTGPGGAKIPASNFTVFLQEKPRPDFPTKGSRYLVGPRSAGSFASPAVALKANEAYSYWLVFETGDRAVAGDYSGTLRFTSGTDVVLSVPIKLKVWPLHAPSRDVLHFEFEHCWLSLPGGWWLDPKVYDVKLLGKYIQRLGDLEVNIGETWGDIGYYYDRNVYLRSDGRPLMQAVRENPELFTSENKPALAFVGPWDDWWTVAIRAGMNGYSQTWAVHTDPGIEVARKALKDEKILPGMPQHLPFLKWFWTEYRTYLRERGLTHAYVKLGDEFGPDAIDEYLPGAMAIKGAGFKPYTTAYNLIGDRSAMGKMDPATDMWQLGHYADRPRELFERNNIPFDKKDEIWGTCASSYWSLSYAYGRGYGYLAAKLRYEGLHTHGYMRWLQNEAEGAACGPDGPADSAAATNWGQGISDGRYLAQLYHWIDFAKQSGRGKDVAEQIEKQIDREIIGVATADAHPLVELELGGKELLGGAETHEIHPVGPTATRCTAAKVQIFEMMLRLRDAIGPIATDVNFDNVSLVAGGKANCKIVCADPALAGLLATRLDQMGGIGVPVVAQMDLTAKDRPATAVLIGTVKDNATLAELVQKELSSQITATYPSAGRYVIERLPATAERSAVVVVTGGDAAGVEIGVRNLCVLLKAENRW